MSAMYFRPVPAFFTRPAPVAHNFAPLFSLLDDSLTQLDSHVRQAQRQFKRPFNPRFDVKENKEAYSVEGELPGFDAKDISIEFLDDGHTLRIKGKTVKETKTEKTPTAAAQAVEGATESSEKAVTETPAETAEASSTSETSSLKSHQATVEDEVKEPANASATTTATEQAVVEIPKAAEQQVTEQQPQKTEESETKNWISERYTGSFTRSFRFSSKVDQEAVKASLKDGILAITLPFARKPESRKIQIE